MARKNKQVNVYPLPFVRIKRNSRFDQILGRTIDAYTPEERKKRWAKAMSFSKANREKWNDPTACLGCIHLDKSEAWCNEMQLPCTVNPITTYQLGILSMACKGEAFEINNLKTE